MTIANPIDAIEVSFPVFDRFHVPRLAAEGLRHRFQQLIRGKWLTDLFDHTAAALSGLSLKKFCESSHPRNATCRS